MQGFLLFQIVNFRSVGEDEITEETRRQQFLGKGFQNSPSGGDQQNPSLLCGLQCGQIFRRQVLVVIQQGAVQVKGDQFYLHFYFSTMCIQVYLNIVTHLLLHSD